MISALERGHLERDLFGPVIIRSAEYNIQCDFSGAARFLTGDYTSKGCAGPLNAVPVYFHFLKGFLVYEAQPAASVHEYLCEATAVHYGTENQCGWCPGCSKFRFVTRVEGDSSITPWVYCRYLIDFSEAAECSFLHVI